METKHLQDFFVDLISVIKDNYNAVTSCDIFACMGKWDDTTYNVLYDIYMRGYELNTNEKNDDVWDRNASKEQERKVKEFAEFLQKRYKDTKILNNINEFDIREGFRDVFGWEVY